jgi:hypothetical protein
MGLHGTRKVRQYLLGEGAVAGRRGAVSGNRFGQADVVFLEAPGEFIAIGTGVLCGPSHEIEHPLPARIVAHQCPLKKRCRKTRPHQSL